jgi:hypothetical protein
VLVLEAIDQIDNVVEAASRAVADQRAGNGDGEMRLARSGASDKDGIALVGDEGAIRELADQPLVDRRAIEVELLDVRGERQLGDGELVFDGARLLLGGIARPLVPAASAALLSRA